MTTLREAIARRIAARKTGVACRTGIGLPDDIWRQALPDADDALAAIEAAGWQCVPKEPTTEMIGVAGPAVDDYYDGAKDASFEGSVKAAFQAMLAAAPKPGEEG